VAGEGGDEAHLGGDLKDMRDSWRDARDVTGALESPLLTQGLVSDRVELCTDPEAIVDWILESPRPEA
jgi:hypothetical protein